MKSLWISISFTTTFLAHRLVDKIKHIKSTNVFQIFKRGKNKQKMKLCPKIHHNNFYKFWKQKTNQFPSYFIVLLAVISDKRHLKMTKKSLKEAKCLIWLLTSFSSIFEEGSKINCPSFPIQTKNFCFLYPYIS